MYRILESKYLELYLCMYVYCLLSFVFCLLRGGGLCAVLAGVW